MIVAVLGVAVILFLGPGAPPDTRTTLASPTTTMGITSTEPIVTTATTAVDREAEVEAILADLWFGWFDAIYRKDPDALWEVVATQAHHSDGVAAFDAMSFEDAPSLEAISISSMEILLDRPDCLVVHYDLDVSGFRGEGAATSTVSVIWPDERFGWRVASAWRFPDDLWLGDCEMEREPAP